MTVNMENYNITMNMYDSLINGSIKSPFLNRKWLEYERNDAMRSAHIPDDGLVHISMDNIEAADFYFINGFAYAMCAEGKADNRRDYASELMKKNFRLIAGGK